MSAYKYISAGSNTTVKTGWGKLMAVHVRPANGATVVIADSANLGTAPDLNNPSATTTIAAVGTYAAATPDTIEFGPNGVGFGNLTVAASSNARLTVVYE